MIWGPAASCRALPTAEEVTQGTGGSWKKLATACRWITHCVVPTPRKGHGHQGSGKDDDVYGIPKGWTFVKKRQA
jgi:hypothetical protein